MKTHNAIDDTMRLANQHGTDGATQKGPALAVALAIVAAVVVVVLSVLLDQTPPV